ncbi:uncharacterized protein JCM10292_000361 [Rhodotorula paludigena]|uniref:uncharacterized protein n=1 Tax=Rhodotorula paludigena TaxID=86838 RepID=UPI00317C53B7
MADVQPVPCIIDTDPGVDDVLAIFLALSSPDLLVLAITVTHGNCTLDAATANLKKVFFALEKHLQQRPDETSRFPNVDLAWRKKRGAGPIEVYLGSAGPIEGAPVTAKYFHGRDGLGDATFRHPDLNPPANHVFTLCNISTASATEGVTTLLSQHPPSTIAYVALGPVTSLAHLHQSAAASGVSPLSAFCAIFSMGGAVNHPGNTTPVAEFNYYADPFAAQLLFALSLPHLYIFPLDLTSYLALAFSDHQTFVDPTFSDTKSPSKPEGKSPLVHFTSSFLERTLEVMTSYGSDAMEQHDPTVIYALMAWARARMTNGAVGVSGDEEELAPGWRFKRVDFEVETIGAITRGMLVQDLRYSSRSTRARPALTNRVQAQDALDLEEVEAHRAEGEQTRAEAVKAHERRSGANVVVSSPGSEALTRDLLRSIWGVAL